MAEDIDPRTALDNLYSWLKMATPADGIYSAKCSAVPPSSSFDEYIPSKDDERLDFTRGNSNTRGRSRQRRNKERGPVTIRSLIVTDRYTRCNLNYRYFLETQLRGGGRVSLCNLKELQFVTAGPAP